jgi:hypothetical protein
MNNENGEAVALLNGKFVQATEIDAGKHRFLGMFRPPADPFKDAKCICICSCGETLRVRGESQRHYQGGCFDAPQYVDIAAQSS